VGRPSLAATRREQLLDAVQACILHHGLAGTTLARIAAEAGMAPSIIRHYLGNKDAVIAAAVERALRNVRAVVVDAVAELPPRDRLAAQLDVLFDPALAVPEINQLIDELVAASYVDPTTHARMRELYEQFTGLMEEGVDGAYPFAPPQARATVAHGVLALAHAAATFHWLDFAPANYARARAAAQTLVDGLGVHRDPPGSADPPAAACAPPGSADPPAEACDPPAAPDPPAVRKVAGAGPS
jgi:AcrR family transcriptional regulator